MRFISAKSFICTGIRVARCSLVDLWNLPATGFTFLQAVSLLQDAAQYPSCGNTSTGSAVLVDRILNTATATYYTGTIPGSRACFVCDENSRYIPNTTFIERVCQSDETWSRSPIICGMLVITTHLFCICISKQLFQGENLLILCGVVCSVAT